jgi:type IV pilus assembly protein PilO
MRSDLSLSERINALGDEISEQFSDLDPQDPAHWPSIPRYTLLVFVSFLVVGLCWYLWLGETYTELSGLTDQETQLKSEFTKKVAKTTYLSAFKHQRDQVRLQVAELERQLPEKSVTNEMLAEVNRLAVLRNLQLEFLRPAPTVVTSYYAEMPVQFGLSGRYHDLAAFAGDIAHIRRVVHLQDLSISSRPDGLLTVGGTLRGYRQLDRLESMNQTAANGGKK